jgi:hypothetical protein
MSSNELSKEEMRRRAEMRFKQAEQRKREAVSALESLRVSREADLAKTQKLKALRLAKAQTDAAAGENQTERKATKKVVRRYTSR